MLIKELMSLQESIKIVFPPEYSSGAAKAAYKLGYQTGYSRKPPLSKASIIKAFDDEVESYNKGYAAGASAEEHEAWQEKNAAGRTYHEDVETDKDESSVVIISKAAEYQVELDKDSEQVTLKNDKGAKIVSMPLVIWKQLTRG